jgi:hypothetical protein
VTFIVVFLGESLILENNSLTNRSVDGVPPLKARPGDSGGDEPTPFYRACACTEPETTTITTISSTTATSTTVTTNTLVDALHAKLIELADTIANGEYYFSLVVLQGFKMFV